MYAGLNMYGLLYAELGTSQYCRDKWTMFLGQKVVCYCNIATFGVATPYRHWDLNIFIYFLFPAAILCCRVVNVVKLRHCRVPSSDCTYKNTCTVQYWKLHIRRTYFIVWTVSRPIKRSFYLVYNYSSVIFIVYSICKYFIIQYSIMSQCYCLLSEPIWKWFLHANPNGAISRKPLLNSPLQPLKQSSSHDAHRISGPKF